jgi:hypothetical protein
MGDGGEVMQICAEGHPSLCFQLHHGGEQPIHVFFNAMHVIPARREESWVAEGPWWSRIVFPLWVMARGVLSP